MITLDNITFSRDGQHIIANTSLMIDKGEAVCLCGPSGIGKTTLLEIAAGLTTPDSGSTTLGSQSIGCAFQDDILVPWLSALDNLLLVMQTNTDDDEINAHNWLERYDLPADMRPTKMSGGMRRRLSLARAFAVQPDILILDEPFAFQDTGWQNKIATDIEGLRKEKAAIFLASHQVRQMDKIHCNYIKLQEKPIALYNE